MYVCVWVGVCVCELRDSARCYKMKRARKWAKEFIVFLHQSTSTVHNPLHCCYFMPHSLSISILFVPIPFRVVSFYLPKPLFSSCIVCLIYCLELLTIVTKDKRRCATYEHKISNEIKTNKKAKRTDTTAKKRQICVQCSMSGMVGAWSNR